MDINYEVAAKMQKISVGAEEELTRGEIASQMVDIDDVCSGLRPEKIEETRAFFEELCKDDNKKVYNADSLMDEIEALRKEVDDFTTQGEYKSYFKKMLNATENLFMNSPFEGMDGLPYGVAELCVYCEVEYFCSRILGYDHKWHRDEYETTLTNKTGEQVSDFWMKLYDDLQERYDSLGIGLESDDDKRLALASCSYITIAAINNQNEAFLDMTTQTAKKNAASLLEGIKSGEYGGMGDDFIGGDFADDNAYQLCKFIDQNFLHLGLE